MARVLELLLSDPDYYEATSADPEREVLGPWQGWVNEIAVEFPGEGPAGSGVAGGSWDWRFTLWDLRWTGDGRCEVMVMDSDTGDEFWWVPPKLPPAELMRHAKWAEHDDVEATDA